MTARKGKKKFKKLTSKLKHFKIITSYFVAVAKSYVATRKVWLLNRQTKDKNHTKVSCLTTTTIKHN